MKPEKAAPSLFEPKPAAGASLFGNEQPTKTVPSLFGNNQAGSAEASGSRKSEVASLFNQNTEKKEHKPSLFGTVPKTNEQPGEQKSLFGGATGQQSIFGNQSSTGDKGNLFGNTKIDAKPSLFGPGAAAPTTEAKGSLFGGSKDAGGPVTNLFT